MSISSPKKTRRLTSECQAALLCESQGSPQGMKALDEGICCLEDGKPQQKHWKNTKTNVLIQYADIYKYRYHVCIYIYI